MNAKELPLVSCVMPTYNRRRFVPLAIEYFLRQEYANKELIIIDDGNDMVEDLIPVDPTIKYFRLNEKITLGAKLNLACNYAQGELVINWDDDDWYSKTRIQFQVDALKSSSAEVCGINNLLYYDLQNNIAYNYIYPANERVWLLGSSLCYTKRLWRQNQFANINVGMDGLFIWATSPNKVKVLDDPTMSVHIIHESNISPKKTDNAWWHPYPVEALQKIMKNDWSLYNKNGNEQAHEQAVVSTNDITGLQVDTKKATLKNVYACLVHESRECVIDLVRNLHYHDPSSVILLYNGGTNSKLLENIFSHDEFNVVIHPKPSPVKHGFLHSFAIDCMGFALENVEFDCLTIVDSDQLAIRSEYTAFMDKFFSAHSNTGMLSNNPERVSADNITNRVAMQAFQEYDLWRPLLDSFKDGEKNFVHWTFWPSTVFAKDAVKDLVKLFKESKPLQEIMSRTKIWASEEVILPTLVKLLGYDILTNPCSYDFVQYQKRFSIQDFNNALAKPDAYWIHPVVRSYDHSLRKYIREYFCGYSKGNKNNTPHKKLPDESFFRSSLIKRLKDIEGWLSDAEANLLIAITERVCSNTSSTQNIVEIGSYHGKSTIVFGSVIKRKSPEARVYAIDTHDGKLGDADKGLVSFPPSFEKFKKNIEGARISDFVEIIKNSSYNVYWEKPVSLLFIDGLHDYLNVSRDFNHFSDWIIKDGYVAFHDYAAYFPGVQKFVDELLTTGSYQKSDGVDSLIVLRKL